MYNSVSFSANKGIRKRLNLGMSNKKPAFEINPLDINIAKMQFGLLKRLELEVPENGDFAAVVEEYQSKDPTLKLSTIRLVCRHVKDGHPKGETRVLEVICKNKDNNEESAALFQGTKKEILEYLKGDNYFAACKKMAEG